MSKIIYFIFGVIFERLNSFFLKKIVNKILKEKKVWLLIINLFLKLMILIVIFYLVLKYSKLSNLLFFIFGLFLTKILLIMKESNANNTR